MQELYGTISLEDDKSKKSVKSSSGLTPFSDEAIQGEKVKLSPHSEYEKDKRKHDNKNLSEISESDSCKDSFVTTVPSTRLVPSFAPVRKQPTNSKFGKPRPSSASKVRISIVGKKKDGNSVGKTTLSNPKSIPSKITITSGKRTTSGITDKLASASKIPKSVSKATNVYGQSSITRGSIQRSVRRAGK